MTKLNRAFACGGALGALLAAVGGAMATDFIVPAGPPVVAPFILPGPGDTLLIEVGGTISTFGLPGVNAQNIRHSVTNKGLITTTGFVADGIRITSDFAEITNSGHIVTSGTQAFGIFSEGDFAQISNSGDITTSNFLGGIGILSGGLNAQITNSGHIATSGGKAHGIFSEGDFAQIRNSGEITTSNFLAVGIWSHGENAQIANSGHITTSGVQGHGILSEGDFAQISNSGEIATEGTDAYGIWSTAADAQVANSGDISTAADDSFGIWSQGPNAWISNSGDITTAGEDAFGIWAQGPNAWISNSGVVTTSGYRSAAIRSFEADSSINNSGKIITSGERGDGIVSQGLNARIDNSGEITTSGPSSTGILSVKDYARINNSGDIATSGYLSHGIYSDGLDAWINNSGDITTTGESGLGINSVGVKAQITNSGDIATSRSSSIGIRSIGNNAQITNNGGITTSGTAADGIRALGNDTRIANNGHIVVSGSGTAIFTLGGYVTVTNSGTVISKQNFAFYFGGGAATLNLLAGTAIQGDIYFNQSDSATLNIGSGLNTALTFEGVPDTINTFGAPTVVQGSVVAVVDPTGFSAQDETLADLTRAISGAVDGRLNAARFGYVPVSSVVTAYVEPDASAGAQATDFGYGTGAGAGAASGFWAAGLGAHRDQDADGLDVGFDSNLGGLLIGFDREVSGGTRVGAFLGASTSNLETNGGSQEIDADSYFGGLYASFTGDSHFLDLAVTGGLSDQSSDRTIANNLVIGGLEHATADYDGLFISPSATIGTSFAMNGGSLIPSLRARYAGLFLDSYDETGSAANLSVEDRDVNVFDFRAQLAYALAARPINDGTLQTAFRFGADAAFADNDDVQTALLGTALNFDVSGDDTVRGFAAVDLSYLTDGGSSFFLGAEAGYDSGDAFTLDVRGGFAVPL